MTGAEGLGSAVSSCFLQPTTSVRSSNPLTGIAGGSGGEGGGSSATISPVGQLLSDLQQLQTQNPTQFQQVVGQIASQLQSAAQQQGQGGNGILSQLADQFRNIANGGSLSQLQPHRHHGHHGGYNRVGQGVSPSSPVSGSTSVGTELAQLFSTIASEVTSALGS